MHHSSSLAETIFIAARELSQPQERDAYLARACSEDPELRRRVVRMLLAEQQADEFLNDNPLGLEESAPSATSAVEKPGTMLGRYKLLQKIGEGGCGVVYMAEQEQPIRRRVAVKVIKLGMDTEQVIARFEAERQALAMMDHPNIARVLDAGATDTGRPYFVMELVRGIRITDYCDQNHCATGERLALFISVAQAIQHAHQKGIIHRDIKPSNVLVTLHDGVPVPKIIDFGVAKAIEQKLTDKTLFTQFEQFIGTPAYTSPEQAEMSGLDIDTRSDIYSLGVLLYELLVGRTPFEAKELLKSGLNEMRRIIREQEPSRPSTILSTMVAQDRTTTAQNRGASAPDLVHQIKGDLDWIVMKCLEKDRTRRYETASGLATDIRNFLSHETVTARPPTAGYRLRKMVRRHKLAFGSAAAVAAALVVGIIVSTGQAARARRAERVAMEEKESAEAVLRFFRDNILAAGRPQGYEGGLGKDVTLRQAVDAAESRISMSFKDRPLVEASIRETLGKSYSHLGEKALAIPQLERAVALQKGVLGELDGTTIATMTTLGHMYREAGKLDQAAPLQEKVIRLAKARLEADSSDAGWLRMYNLGAAYGAMGRFELAIPLYEESLKLEKTERGPDNPKTLWAMHYLAETYKEVRRIDKALPLFNEILERRKATLGQDHPDTLWAMHYLAAAHAVAGDVDKALSLDEETLRLRTKKLGLNHPDTLWSMNNLAGRYIDAGRREEALKLDEQTFLQRRVSLGEHHSLTLESMRNLADGYKALGKNDEAEALCRQSLAFDKGSFSGALALARLLFDTTAEDASGSARARARTEEGLQLVQVALTNARTLYDYDRAGFENALYELADLCYRRGHLSAAHPLYGELVQCRRDRLGPGHTEVITATASLGRLLAELAWVYRTTKPEAAEHAREGVKLLRECHAMNLEGPDAGHWRVAEVKCRLGGALVSLAAADREQGAAAREARLAEGELLLLDGYEVLRDNKSVDAKYKRDALERLVRLYETMGQSDKLADWQQKLAALDETESKLATAAAGVR